VNTAVTSLFVSPNHFDCSVDALTLTKQAPDSAARALASIVFPVPGGPNSRTPLACLSSDERKSAGSRSGAMTFWCSATLMSSRPPTSCRPPTSRLSFVTTSSEMTSS